MNKIITDELINERLEAKGFGDKQADQPWEARKSVMDHFDIFFTDNWTDKADFYVYPESTSDGYEVWVATEDIRSISLSEDVHYYDSNLGEPLEEFIRYSNGDNDFPSIIYVDDEEAHYVEYAIEQLFCYLAERFTEEVTDELINEGYELEEVLD